MMRDELEDLVKHYGLEESVFFMGEQSNPYRYMKGADYLLVPSRHEAAPVVFAEAKALKLPIISTETISAKELISEDCGVVVENNTESLIKAIEELLYHRISFNLNVLHDSSFLIVFSKLLS